MEAKEGLKVEKRLSIKQPQLLEKYFLFKDCPGSFFIIVYFLFQSLRLRLLGNCASPIFYHVAFGVKLVCLQGRPAPDLELFNP